MSRKERLVRDIVGLLLIDAVLCWGMHYPFWGCVVFNVGMVVLRGSD